jgi:hypothetical protein
VDLDSQRQGKCVVLKTSTRQTVFLPVVGLVRHSPALSPKSMLAREGLGRAERGAARTVDGATQTDVDDCLIIGFNTLKKLLGLRHLARAKPLPCLSQVPPDELKPGDLVGVNKDSYLILDTLPAEYDARVKVSFLGDAESSLGDAESSLGDAKSSLGDALELAG